MEKPFRLILLTGLCCLGASAFSQTKHVTFTFTVEDESRILITLNYLEHNDCVGGPGLIQIETSGGVNALSYSWTGPGGFTSTEEDIENLTVPGDYTLTVDDGNGCPVSKTFSILNTCPYTCSGFYVDVSFSSDPTNCTVADGVVEYEINGGVGPFTWEFFRVTDVYTSIASGTTPTRSFEFNSLSQATYEIAVTDQNGCTTYSSVEFKTSFYLYEPYISGTNTSCSMPNGSLNLTVVGAQLPEDLSVDWVNTDTNIPVTTNVPSFDEAVAGYYAITVTDNKNGCKLYGGGYVTNYMIDLDVTSTVTGSTKCVNPDGAIDITVSSGTGDYAYVWTSDNDPAFNATSEDLSSLSTGFYSVYAYDRVSRCYIAASIEVNDLIDYPTITPGAPIPNSACTFPYNGALSVTASGTPGPYAYGWFSSDIDPFTTLANPTNVAPGKYGYLVTDASTGCTAIVSSSGPDAIVVEDTSFPVTAVTESIDHNRSCNAPFNGAIDVSINASGHDYTLEWWFEDEHYDPFSEDEDLVNAPPGVYELRLSVACAGNNPPVITAPNLNATSGVTTIDLDLLTIISDPDNNLDPASIAITSQPESGADAAIVNNGTTVILSLDYTGITFNGTDQLRIRACDDLDVCTERDLMVNVNVTAETDLVVFNAISINADPLNTHFHIQNIEMYENRVTIYNRWGDPVYDATDYNNESVSFVGETDNGKELPSGTYFYKIEIEGNKTLSGYLSLKR